MIYVTRHNLWIILLAIIILLTGFNTSNMQIMGIFLVITSVVICYDVRHNKAMFFMMCIVSLVNINVGIFNCIMGGYGAPAWQINRMLSSEFNEIMTKSIVLNNTIVMLFLCGGNWKYLKKDYNNIKDDFRPNGNILITIGGIVILAGILVYGFVTEILGRTSGYTSVETPLYEYSCIIVALVWFFSKNWDERIKKILGIYTSIFIIMFLLIGDRSSVVIIATLYFILYFRNKFSTFKFIALTFAAIVVLNIVGFVRDGFSGDIISVFVKMLSSGIYVDTVTYAYYTSVTLCALNSYLSNPFVISLSYLQNIFLLGNNEYTSLTIFARENYSDLYNLGGGMYPSYFYSMGGYFGVIVGALILCIVLHFVFSKGTKYAQLYQFVITALTFRWYLYSFTTLYKGGLIFLSLALFVCVLFNRISTKT